MTPGAVLPNGAIVVHHDEPRELVLAILPGNEATPYVVWHLPPGSVSCFHGGYCATFHGAVSHFAKRGGRIEAPR